MIARCCLAVLTLHLLTTAVATAQPREALEKIGRELTLKRLQGVWVPDLLITPQGAERYPLAGRALALLDGDKFIRLEGKRNVASGTFKFEDGFLWLTIEDRSPWDLEAAESKPRVRYTFKTEGQVLTLCYSVGDKGKAGDLTPGEGRLVVVYKRGKVDPVSGATRPLR